MSINVNSNYFFSSESNETNENTIQKKEKKSKSIITVEYNENGQETSKIKQVWDKKTESWVTTREFTYFSNGWIESYKKISKKNPKKTTTYRFYDNANIKSVEHTNKDGETTKLKEYFPNGKQKKD